MKKKFIRVISPIALTAAAALDISIIYFAVFAVNKIRSEVNFYSVSFLIIVVFAFIIAVPVTKEIVTQGIIFRESELEFTALDSDSVFKYDEIESLEFLQDTKASLVKNFSDRQSRIIISLKSGKSVTVDIGLTTKRLFTKVEKEMRQRTGK